jgi:hypothetical protein
MLWKCLEIMCDFIFYFFSYGSPAGAAFSAAPYWCCSSSSGGPTVRAAQALRRDHRQGAPVLPLHDLWGRARHLAF